MLITWGELCSREMFPIRSMEAHRAQYGILGARETSLVQEIQADVLVARSQV